MVSVEPEQGRTAKKRVLFVGEAVTLAHVARPTTLARSLDPEAYDVCFAAHPRFNGVLGDLPFKFRPIHTIPCEQFLTALAQGNPMYDHETLSSYVEEDLAVMDEFRPDIVVGDFRLSLAISARMAGVRYAAILNAYWSPFARRHFPMPELSISQSIGVPLAKVLFSLLRPVGFAVHARPMNRTRQRFGMKALSSDPRAIYSEADDVLYADIPELVPTFSAPNDHQYIGPIHWSPDAKLPEWWDQLPDNRPIIYVTLGSSGSLHVLGVTLRALGDLPVTVIAATAARVDLGQLPPNVYVSEYLPGDQAAGRSRLVICNGGSPTTQQALAAGVPVLGIPSNMDQHLNMYYLLQAGVGGQLRAETITANAVCAAVLDMLADAEYSMRAKALGEVISGYDVAARFKSALDTKSIWRVQKPPNAAGQA